MKNLNQAIIDIAPRYNVSDNAPNTWEDLQADYKKHGIITVFAGACERSIYNNVDVNHAFRAWHDKIHLEHGLSFSYEDELEVARIHCAALPKYADVLWADVAGQVWYYYKYGKYVKDQAAFVNAFITCYNYGELPSYEN